MEIRILNKKENVFFSRTEIDAEVLHAGQPTPKRTEAKKLLAAQLGADETLLLIRNMTTNFSDRAKMKAVLYKDQAHLDKNEPKYIIGRNTGAKKKRVGKAKK